MRSDPDLKKHFFIYKMAVAYSDRRKQFLLEEMAEMCPKLE